MGFWNPRAICPNCGAKIHTQPADDLTQILGARRTGTKCPQCGVELTGRVTLDNKATLALQVAPGESGEPATSTASGSSGGDDTWAKVLHAWRQRSGKEKGGLIAGAIVLVFAVTALGSGESESTQVKTLRNSASTEGRLATGEDAPERRVPGTLDKGCFTCEDEPQDALRASNVWCAWDGDHVKVHAVLHNGLNARVIVSVAPAYRIERGGDHGNSLGSDTEFKIGPEETIEVMIVAGKPEGVEPSTPISSCEPTLEKADIG